MTVANLCELFDNWTLFSNVRIYCAATRLSYDYNCSRDALRDWANSPVNRFSCDSNNDLIGIDVRCKVEGK